MAATNTAMSLFSIPPRPQSTPPHSPQRDGISVTGLTAAEKQAMIDDLQLEITKRARGLRAIYNEQARQLRESLERRLHRIPPRMRSKTMGELSDEQAKKMVKPTQAVELTKSTRRTSDVAFATEDKENAPTGDLQPQKKRVKAAEPRQKPATIKTTAASPVKSVLSPRSHNSRTLPAKIASPEKSSRLLPPQQKIRPVSRTASRQAAGVTKKSAVKQTTSEDPEGRDSEASTTSAKTTIVKRVGPASKRPAAKKAAPKATTTTSTTRKRAPAAKAETTAPPITRTLRKRG